MSFQFGGHRRGTCQRDVSVHSTMLNRTGFVEAVLLSQAAIVNGH